MGFSFMKREHGIIQHNGIVQKVDENSVLVSISSSSACSGCHSEGVCSVAGKEEKLINIQGKYSVSPGETVTVQMKQSEGYRALLLVYIVPLLIIITTLVILISLSLPEAMAGLISLLALIPYLLILFLLRKKINQSFTFAIKV